MYRCNGTYEFNDGARAMIWVWHRPLDHGAEKPQHLPTLLLRVGQRYLAEFCFAPG